MWREHWIVWLAVVAVGVTGCGGPDETGRGANSDRDTEMQSPVVNWNPSVAGQTTPAGLSGPAAAVFEFHEAVRTGNDEKAASMLTATARRKIAEMDPPVVVAPPGSDTAKFEVGRVEYLAEDGARVASTWSDRDEDSQRRTDELLWMVRREPEGWRIAGVAATVFEGEPPVLLNFEDPEEMLRKQQRVRELARQRAEKGDFQAHRPENSVNSTRR